MNKEYYKQLALDIISTMGFSVFKQKNCLKVKDNYNNNFAGVENNKYNDLEEILLDLNTCCIDFVKDFVKDYVEDRNKEIGYYDWQSILDFYKGVKDITIEEKEELEALNLFVNIDLLSGVIGYHYSEN